jgi:hypothetical protein
VTVSRVRRWVASVAIAGLLVSQAFVATVSAADTRLIYVGSGPVGTDPGLLTLTPVTVGGASATNVIVKNIDNQNLSHVKLTFAAPAAGLTLSGWFGTNAGSCTPVDPSPLLCDFGNLAKGQTRTLTVLYTATAAVAASISAQITFNETKPNGGSNTHIEPIGGNVTPTNGGCDAVATFLPPGQVNKVVGTGCALSSSNPQITSVAVPGSLVSAIRVADETGTLCDPSVVCFGQNSIADIAVDTTDTVIWTITWQVPANFNVQKLGVLHFPDGSTTANLNITLKKDLCKSDTATGCFVPGMTTLNGTTLTTVIRTKGNGGMRGFS